MPDASLESMENNVPTQQEYQLLEDVTQNVIEEANHYFETCPFEGYVERVYTEVPAGSENKESRELIKLLNNPYEDSKHLYEEKKSEYSFSEESFQLIEADIRDTMERISKNPLEKLRRVNGQPDFYSRRFSDVVVRSVTAEEVIETLGVNSQMKEDEIRKKVMDENYRRLGVAFDRRWKLPEGTSSGILGALFHCSPHEDISGFVFAVRATLHGAVSHKGAVSKVKKEVIALLTDRYTPMGLNEEKD